MPSCHIRCEHCRKEFNSPIQFGDAGSFFTSELAGNKVLCPNCKKWGGCNKENMIFRSGDEGFVGKDV